MGDPDFVKSMSEMNQKLDTIMQEFSERMEVINERIDSIAGYEPKKPCTDIPVAVVEIIRGVAEVTRKDYGFLLRIIDRDVMGDGTVTLRDATQTYMMEDVVKDEETIEA